MQFFKDLFGKKKLIVITQEQAPKNEVPILSDEEKKVRHDRNMQLLLDSIGKGNTLRRNIDGHSMLYTRRKNEQTNT